MSVAQRTLGSRIREARLAANLTQASLALKSGTRERNIVRWENDQHAPRLEHVSAIARATGKDIDFFLVAEDGTDQEEDEEADPVVALMSAIRGVVRSELAKELA